VLTGPGGGGSRTCVRDALLPKHVRGGARLRVVGPAMAESARGGRFDPLMDVETGDSDRGPRAPRFRPRAPPSFLLLSPRLLIVIRGDTVTKFRRAGGRDYYDA